MQILHFISIFVVMTKEIKAQKQREYRIKNGNSCTRKYEKTHKGFLVRLYRNMLSRISGVQKKNIHLYSGLEILPKAEFYNWALNNPAFLELYKGYEASNYERKLAPSVDRINSKQGYYIANMEFVTMSENSRRGSISKFRTKYKKTANATTNNG